MQFELDEDRALLKQSTRDWLAREAPLAENRVAMEDGAEGFSKAVYGQLAELGYFGLLLPEERGGAALGARALAAVLEEMGRVAFPGPFLDQVLALEVLHRCADPAALDWISRVLEGTAWVVLARGERLQATEAPAAECRFRGGRVRGCKQFVPFGAFADALLVTTDRGLVLVPRPGAGWSAAPLETLDHAQRFAEIGLDAPGQLLAEPAAAAPILGQVERLAALGSAATALGLMQRALELTVAYLGQRQAFGAPLASFQVLQHRAADMLVQTESTRAAVYRAAWLLDERPEQAPLAIAAAKVWSDDAGRQVCGEAIQLHGGVGFTWEYDPHVLFKRIVTLGQFYGTPGLWLEEALHAAGL